VSGVDAEPQPKWTFHVDRPSARTEAEREEHFQAWLDKFGQPYTDAVIEAAIRLGLPMSSKDASCSCAGIRH
jgi:hypothetical protein